MKDIKVARAQHSAMLLRQKFLQGDASKSGSGLAWPHQETEHKGT